MKDGALKAQSLYAMNKTLKMYKGCHLTVDGHLPI